VIAGAADGLCDVEVALVAGESVEHDDDGMASVAGGEVHESVHACAVTGYAQFRHRCGMIGVVRVLRRRGCRSGNE
jgi:hypothetical protein